MCDTRDILVRGRGLFWAWSPRALWGFTRFFLRLRKTRLPTCLSLVTGLPKVPLVYLKISTHALRMPHGVLCENILLLTFQKVFAILILLLWHYSSAFMKWNKNRAESCVCCRHISPNKDPCSCSCSSQTNKPPSNWLGGYKEQFYLWDNLCFLAQRIDSQ